MKAVVFHDIGDIRLESVPEPKLQQPCDAIVRITASAICGTDLHMIRGSLPGMKPGLILGHEGVGVVEEVGRAVHNLRAGDRVVIPSTIACGYCSHCKGGCYSQCDNANPNGPHEGTAFFGGPEESGSIPGLQAEFARVPFADAGLVKLPDEVSDDQAILLSDIFPTGYFGAEIADINKGDTVVVFGCGPVGLFTIVSARLLGATQILAVDTVPDRLQAAKALGAEAIDYNAEDPVKAIRCWTHDVGASRVIDAVGVDANQPKAGLLSNLLPSAEQARHKREQAEVAPRTSGNGHWQPGDAPSQALDWAVQVVAKCGTLSIIGVYPSRARFFPIGLAMSKNVTVRMGNCPHRKYLPMLVSLVRNGSVDPTRVLKEEIEPITSAIEAYKAFDQRQRGWIKVKLEPAAAQV
jgi:threonine dehydrogenase-like Zn-dependent dehydrogenase